MRALQYMRAGAKLVFQTRPVPRIDLEKGPVWFLIHPTTARILVAYRWVDLYDFNANRGIYRLHPTGRALTDRVCEHRHLDDERTERFGEKGKGEGLRLLCRDCWGVVNCVSRKSAPHAATRWHWRYGAVCDRHP